jgi:hypothetical protein
MMENAVIKPDTIRQLIYTFRGIQVMIDRDLSSLYDVETRVLNQAVKRNQERFPEAFCFQLSDAEFKDWKSQTVIELLMKSLSIGGIILIGEPYWRQLPPSEEVAKDCHAGSISAFLILPELLRAFGDLGYDVVEMVLADQDGWDRYEAAKWFTMRRWLEANPDDDFQKEVRAQLTSEPKRYAAHTREYLGWGVFALMKL